MSVERCCICHAPASTVAMTETHLPGDRRCRDQVSCRRRVRGQIESAKLAASLEAER